MLQKAAWAHITSWDRDGSQENEANSSTSPLLWGSGMSESKHKLIPTTGVQDSVLSSLNVALLLVLPLRGIITSAVVTSRHWSVTQSSGDQRRWNADVCDGVWGENLTFAHYGCSSLWDSSWYSHISSYSFLSALMTQGKGCCAGRNGNPKTRQAFLIKDVTQRGTSRNKLASVSRLQDELKELCGVSKVQTTSGRRLTDDTSHAWV